MNINAVAPRRQRNPSSDADEPDSRSIPGGLDPRAVEAQFARIGARAIVGAVPAFRYRTDQPVQVNVVADAAGPCFEVLIDFDRTRSLHASVLHTEPLSLLVSATIDTGYGIAGSSRRTQLFVCGRDGNGWFVSPHVTRIPHSASAAINATGPPDPPDG